VLQQLKWFAGNQIRNVACFGGSITAYASTAAISPHFHRHYHCHCVQRAG
jgi:hypothetical protein